MSQSISRRSFLKCAGSGAVSLAAALLTGVPAAAQQPRLAGEPALLDGKAAVELLGYAPAQEMGNVLVYLSVENLSASTLPVGASYLQSREVCTLGDLYSMGTGVTAVCDGKPVRCGSFAAPLYGENAADASVFTLNLTAGRGALLHCFCAVPDNWQTLELTYHPDFAAGRSVTFTVNRSTDRAVLGVVLQNAQNSYNFGESLTYGITGGVGFLLAIVLFASVRERMEFSKWPKAFDGFPIALVAASLISLAFMGFSGLKVW